MKPVHSSTDNGQVALMESILEAAGIPFELRNDAVSQAMPTMDFAAELWVEDEKFDEASRLIAESQAAS